MRIEDSLELMWTPPFSKRLTRYKLQKDWEKGFVCLVYDKQTQCVKRRYRNIEDGLKLHRKGFGLILLCNQLS